MVAHDRVVLVLPDEQLALPAASNDLPCPQAADLHFAIHGTKVALGSAALDVHSKAYSVTQRDFVRHRINMPRHTWLDWRVGSATNCRQVISAHTSGATGEALKAMLAECRKLRSRQPLLKSAGHKELVVFQKGCMPSVQHNSHTGGATGCAAERGAHSTHERSRRRRQSPGVALGHQTWQR